MSDRNPILNHGAHEEIGKKKVISLGKGVNPRPRFITRFTPHNKKNIKIFNNLPKYLAEVQVYFV